MPTLTDLQIAAALSEQAYRRSDLDQQLNNNDIGVADAVQSVSGMVEDGGYFYNYATGFVGRIVEANGKIFVVYRGTDVSGGPLAIADAIAGTGWADGYADTHDWQNNLALGSGTLGESQLADALALYEAAVVEANGREVVVTGQSLGGGLAGLVSAIKDVTGYAIAPAPFLNQLRYEATFAALDVQGISREDVDMWNSIYEGGILYSVDDAFAEGGTALEKVLQQTSLSAVQKAAVVADREAFLDTYTQSIQQKLNIHTIQGEALTSGAIGSVLNVLGAEQLHAPDVQYDVGDGSAVSLHGSGLHNLVIRTEGSSQAFSELLRSDKILRDAFLDNPEIVAPEEHDRADPDVPENTSRMLGDGPNPAIIYNALWKTVDTVGGFYENFYNRFDTWLSYGAVEDGKSASVLNDFTVHAGVVRIGLQVVRDAVDLADGNAVSAVGTEVFGAGTAEGPTAGYVRVSLDDISSSARDEFDQYYGEQDINIAVYNAATDSVGNQLGAVALVSDALGESGSELLLGASLGGWRVLVAQAGTASAPDSSITFTPASGDSDKSHVVFGGASVDTIKGSSATDYLIGGNGDNVFEASGGRDVIVGGEDDDTYLAATTPAGAEGGVFFFGGIDGGDKADYSGYSPDGVVATWYSLPDVSFGRLVVDRQDSGSPDIHYDIEKFVGTDQTDHLFIAESGSEFVSVDTGGGDDIVDAGGTVGVNIQLGAGQDEVKGGIGSLIHTGSDNDQDIIHWSPGSIVTNGARGDVLMLGEQVVTLATLVGESESPYAYGLGGLVKVGFNDAGEMGVGSMVREGHGAADLMYFAEGNPDPLASHEELTAGVRTGKIEINAYQLLNVPAGISTADNADLWEFMRLSLKDFFAEHRVGGTDPLVLDLDGDGLELSAVGLTGGLFDMDGDLFAEPTGWVLGDDGFLAIDLNSNGTIDDISEFFGHGDVSGFAELAALDSNTDGVIDAADTAFADLRVWQDLDGDSVTDPGELKTLAELDIASIGLTATPDGSTNALNTVARTGTFTRTDATTGTIGDIEFRIDNYNTTFLGDTSVDPAIAATMPNLKGRGTLTDLHVAMTLEGTSGPLEATINSVLPTLDVIDLATLRERALPILQAWAAAPPAVPPPGNPDVPVLVHDTAGGTQILDFAVEVTETITLPDQTTQDVTFWRLASGAAVKDDQDQVIEHPTYAEVLAQITGDPDKTWDVLTGAELDYLERYIGEDIPIEDPRALNLGAVTALSDLLEKGHHIIELQALRLAMQGPLEPYFAGVEYDPVDDGFKPTTNGQLVPMFEAIFTAAPGDAAGATAWLQSWEPLIDAFLADYERGGSLLNTFPFMFTTVVAAAENVGLAISVKEAAVALGLPGAQIDDGSGTRDGTSTGDIFYLSSGDDVVRGGQGADVYVVGQNFGSDVIDDIETGADEYDTLRFAHINPADVTLYRNGRDLQIVENATGNTITVLEEFHDILPDALGNNTLPDRGVNEIVFADGTVWTRSEIALAVSHPTAADEVLEGTDHIDVLDGGGGNDILRGGNNTDIYVFGRDYGTDRVEEDSSANILISTEDFLRLGPNVRREDLTFSRDGDDLIISIDGTTDQLTIAGQFAATYTGPFGQQWFNRVETLIFDDGRTMSWDEVARQVLLDSSTDGDDTIIGYSTEDVLDGGAGNDYLSGGNENDTYYFGLGYGHDTIEDNLTNILSGQVDKVIFRDGIASADVTFLRDANGDLEVAITGATDKLTVVGQFDFVDTGPFGIQAFDMIESFEFADGTAVTWQTVMEQAVANQASAGDDTIHGFYFGDRLDGGAGNDLLSGHSGDDVYVFGRGYGHDIVDDAQGSTGDAADAVEFTSGLTLADVTFARGVDDQDLLITTDTGDTLTLKDQFTPTGFGWIFNEIEEFRFEDGTTLTSAAMRQLLVDQATTAGNDVILGSGRGETFHASAGDDVLNGAGGPDIYEFGPGSGHDTINESRFNIWDDDPNEVHFSAGVLPSDVQISRNGTDLVLTLASTGDTLTVTEQFDTNSDRYVESYVFTDGTVWTRADMVAAVATMTGTSGNDTLVGAPIDETFYGLEGNDVLNGDGGADQMFGGAGDDTIFADGGNDTLEGGTGNDHLEGSSGGDTYTYRRGDGDDVIFDHRWYDWANDTDRVVFADIDSTEVSVSRDGNSADLLLTVGGSIPGSILVTDHFETDHEIESFEFADSVVWSAADVRAMLVSAAGTPGDDTINGTSSPDIIAGLAGNDTIYAHGSNDTIEGGTGNDHLEGSAGNDIYIYSRGDGDDVIFDHRWYDWSHDTDRIVFTDIDSTEASLTRSGGSPNLLLTIGGAVPGSVLVTEQFETDHRIEFFEFADNVEWSAADVRSLVLAAATTSGDDTIHGFNDDDTIAGGAGNDTVYAHGGSDTIEGGTGNDYLEGSSGSDIYTYRRGDGDDVIFDHRWYDWSHDTDRIVFTDIDSTEVSLSRNGNSPKLLLTIGGAVPGSILVTEQFETDHRIEFFEFADNVEWNAADIQALVLAAAATSGDDTIHGFNDDDTIAGGAGNDTIYGYGGSDTIEGGTGNDRLEGSSDSDIYIYNRGDGDDVISDYQWWGSSSDRLVFTDINSTEVSVSRADNGADIVLTVGGGVPGSIVINDHTDPKYTLEVIEFADAVTWGNAELSAAYLASAATGGDDVIWGFDGVNETINGGAGNDTLYGYSGDDTLLGGDGDDLLIGGSGVDNLDGGAGIDTADYSDGGTWTLDLSAGTATSGSTVESLTAIENIKSGGGADTLVGNADDNVLMGGYGSDLYRFSQGGGDDEIVEDGSSSNFDTLELVGLNVADIVLSRTPSDLLVTIAATGETMRVTDHFLSKQRGIETLRFADGTEWNRGTMEAEAWYRGTSGNDIIVGTGGSETFVGGTGDDILDGSYGSDTYRYASGDGNDQITENNSTTPNDVLHLVDLNIGDVKLGRPFAATSDLEVTVIATGESILIPNHFASKKYGIETLRFADGTEWNGGTISSNAPYRGTDGDDSFTGNSSANIIYGEAGNDILKGGSGDDQLFGDAGDDVLQGDGGTDSFDGGAGNDTVDYGYWTSTSGTINLATGIGSAGGVSETLVSIENVITGGGNDTLIGDAGANVLTAGGGNDDIEGGAGDDTLTGNSGADTFIFRAGFGADTITDFEPGTGGGDVIAFHDGLFADFADVLAAATETASDVHINYDANNVVTLKNVQLSALHQDDFQFAA